MIKALLIDGALVASAVLVHYEALNRLSMIIPSLPIPHRLRVLLGVFGALFAHVIEIVIFAFGYYIMIHRDGYGTLEGLDALEGQLTNTIADCTYFSFVSYTSLGFGDIVAKGDVRFLSGLEALTGLVLIAWTASFMFIEMQKLWKDK